MVKGKKTGTAKLGRRVLCVRAIALLTLSLLALATIASATAQAGTYLFNPTLSLTGDCSTTTYDPVADPGCPGGEHPPSPFAFHGAVALDPYGNRYVASWGSQEGEGSRIDVFDSSGSFITELANVSHVKAIAVDTEGVLYVHERTEGLGFNRFSRFVPTVYQPQSGTIAYGASTTVVDFENHINVGTGCVGGNGNGDLAIDPATNRLYFNCWDRVAEYGSAEEGNPLLDETIAAPLVQGGETRLYWGGGLAIDSAHQKIYAAGFPNGSSSTRVVEVWDLQAPHELLATYDGSNTPGKKFFSAQNVRVAVDEESGEFFVSDLQAAKLRIYEFAPDGSLVNTITEKLLLNGFYHNIAIDNGAQSPTHGDLFVPTGNGAGNHSAVFEPETTRYTLAVTVAGAGSVSADSGSISGCTSAGGAACQGEYKSGSTVILTANPGAGSTFAGWSGACSGAAPTCEVTMSEAGSVTVTFEEGGGSDHTLTLEVEGPGELAAPEDVLCPSVACEASYEDGASVTLSAIADEGAHLVELVGCDSEPAADECQLQMDEDRTVKATFAADVPSLPLTVSVEGSGTVGADRGLISCNPFCEDDYPEGTEVTLTASPGAGALFMAWRHCDKGGVNGRQCTVAIDEAKQVSAIFQAAHSLTLSKAEGSGPGRVQSSPGGLACLYACESATASFAEGAKVTLKATPAKHFHLASWGGDCAGAGSCEVTMGEEHAVTASFAEDEKLTLSITKTGGGEALIRSKPAGLLCGYACGSQSASFYAGENVEVEVTLGRGTTKLTWTAGAGTCAGSTEAPVSTCTVPISAARELAAELD